MYIPVHVATVHVNNVQHSHLLYNILQVHSFSSRSSEQSLRLMCLEHLGVIAARLRRDATAALDQDHQELIDILAQVHARSR